MSCLFNSLTKLLQPELHNIPDLRQAVCDEMQNNRQSILENDSIQEWIVNVCIDRYNQDDLTDAVIDRYISEMRSSSTWGGAPEIAIISKMFNVDIIVEYSSTNIATFSNHKNEYAPTLYLHWTGGHYTPIRRDESNTCLLR